MNNKTRAIIGVVLTATIWPLGFYLATRETDEHRILRAGAEAEATIVGLVDQHETRHDHRPLMRITVDGEWAGATHHTHVDRRIDDDDLGSFVVGARVAIRYDRERPDDIVVVDVTGSP